MSLKKPELKHHLSDVVQQVINNKRENEAHAMFRAQPGHGDKTEEHISPGIEHPGSTGVIYVTERATANGFYYGNPEWSNLGQGAPEVGDIPGANPKPKSIDLEAMGMWVHEYASVSGTPELRKKVAEYYNATYRQGKSQFTAANIAIVPGGRAGLARVASCIGPVMTGYSLPEYTAYESLLGCFKSLIPIPTQLKKENGYKLDVEDVKREVRDRGYSAMMASNPRNPTGALVEGEELKEWVKSASDLGYTLILDEFYSHYILEGELGRAVSAAEYIDNIEEESVVLIDGLTKNWRCPGWRVCWVVGNSDMISAISQAGSYLDGGANHIFQVAALPLMDLDHIKQDRLALQKHFRMKRDHIMKRLEQMGLPIKFPPRATFYLWVDLSGLPAPLNSGMAFAEELLREKCIVTPGIFFDVNPSHRRKISDSPCEPFIRLSYGPTLEECDRGLDAFERVLKKSTEDHSKHQLGTNYIPTKKD